MVFFGRNTTIRWETHRFVAFSTAEHWIQDASLKNIEDAPFEGKLMPRQDTSMSTLEPSPISRQWTMERQETLEPPFSRQCSMEFLDFEGDFCRQCTIDSCFAVQVDVSCMKVMKVGEFVAFLAGLEIVWELDWVSGARWAFILQSRLSIDFIILYNLATFFYPFIGYPFLKRSWLPFFLGIFFKTIGGSIPIILGSFRGVGLERSSFRFLKVPAGWPSKPTSLGLALKTGGWWKTPTVTTSLGI